jgi:hypothetical protein
MFRFSVFKTSICAVSPPCDRMLLEFSVTLSWRPSCEMPETYAKGASLDVILLTIVVDIAVVRVADVVPDWVDDNELVEEASRAPEE